MRALFRVAPRVAAALLVLSLSLMVYAQGDAGNKRSNPGSSSGPAGGGKVEKTRTVYVDRPGPPGHDRIIRVLPKTGALTIVAESGASLRLQYLRGDDVVKEYKGEGYTVGSGERSIIFKNLPPGRYKVVAELPGYTPATSAPVTVKAGGTDKVDLTLVQITYNVTIKLNAGSGTLTYAKGGEVSRSVRFQNGVAVLSGLTGGDYSIKIMPDDASYVQKDTNLRVSSDNQVSFDLDRLESKDFLGATASAWTLPNGWSFASGKVIVRGSGMALPSDSSYSHYQNFQLSTDVRMINGIAASFVVHVVDARNYYLVQITGPNADEPYVLRGFIVKGGVPQRFGRTIPTSQFSETLKPGKFFHVVLTMNDADITVRVQDSETGELLKLGILPDSSRTFRIGGVGIAAREGEQSEFSSFAICVSGCT